MVLAYYAANLNDYSVYGFGRAYEAGVAGGRTGNLPSEPNAHIGLGIYGGVMGGWMRGLVYGTYLKGERYSLYVDGKTYTNEPIVELVSNTDGSRTPAYGVVSEQPDVYAKGKAKLQNGKQYIAFSKTFCEMAKMDELVITISPLENSKGLYIADQDARGFWVKENGEGSSSTAFSWIAMATRKELGQMQHAPELLQKEFDTKMNNVMYNDNNTNGTPQSIWWDGSQVRFDKPPVKKPVNSYQPVVRGLK
jgi:hypothetical protein